MKVLLKVLAVSFAVFMAMAMVEEREAFLPLFAAFSGSAAQETPATLPAQERQAAVDTVRELLSLWSHLEESGGDARFAERLPASPEVVGEMMTEIAYLQHNYRRQEQKLMKLEVVQTEAAGPGRLSVTTREFWIIRTFSSFHRQQEPDPPRSTVVNVRYLLERDGRQWRVSAWSHLPALTEPP